MFYQIYSSVLHLSSSMLHQCYSVFHLLCFFLYSYYQVSLCSMHHFPVFHMLCFSLFNLCSTIFFCVPAIKFLSCVPPFIFLCIPPFMLICVPPITLLCVPPVMFLCSTCYICFFVFIVLCSTEVHLSCFCNCASLHLTKILSCAVTLYILQ